MSEPRIRPVESSSPGEGSSRQSIYLQPASEKPRSIEDEPSRQSASAEFSATRAEPPRQSDFKDRYKTSSPPPQFPPARLQRPATICDYVRSLCGCFSRPVTKSIRKTRPGCSSYEAYWNATQRIYNESECERAREQGLYIFTFWLVWDLVITQLIISALITGFTASMTANVIAPATLGGVNFIITSLLGFLRTEPERRWRNAHEYEKVVDHIDSTIEYLWFTKGNKLADGQLANAVQEAFDKHQMAKDNVALNRSGDFARILTDRVTPNQRSKVDNGLEKKGASEEAGVIV